MGNGSAPQVRGAPGECLCLTCWMQEGNSRGERPVIRTNPPCTGIRCLKHRQSLHVSSKNGSAVPHSPQNKSRAPSPGLQALRNPHRPSRGRAPSHLAFLCLAVPLLMLFLLGDAFPVVGMRLSAQVSPGSSNNSYFSMSRGWKPERKVPAGPVHPEPTSPLAVCSLDGHGAERAPPSSQGSLPTRALIPAQPQPHDLV